MNIEFLSTVAVIAPDPPASRKLYVDALGLPLESQGGDYYHSEQIAGCKSFGIWPLAQAAEACFGTPQWPADRPVPQVSIEFDVADVSAVGPAARELEQAGYELLHPPRKEPWGKRPPGCNHRRARWSASPTPLCCTTKADPRSAHHVPSVRPPLGLFGW
jgi:catechol 2,3-dioxygenase-like lactoylglutathione lyase family enzyme